MTWVYSKHSRQDAGNRTKLKNNQTPKKKRRKRNMRKVLRSGSCKDTTHGERWGRRKVATYLEADEEEKEADNVRKEVF